MHVILIAIVSLGILALVLSLILYMVSKKFSVYEDPRISQIAAVLPQANCGGCGYPGCNGFAGSCVENNSLEDKYCPVGGQEVMNKVAEILNLSVSESELGIAVVKCNGTCENRPHINSYDGVKHCSVVSALCEGETGCSYGCLGYGDCTNVCLFDAIHINPLTGLPEVDESKCTACGACVKMCPRNIIEIRPRGKKNRRIYVQCMNQDKGAIAGKICRAACIGCGKCVKVCSFEAITLKNNLAYIDADSCRLCRKCEEACPQNAIIATNFPVKKTEKMKTTADAI